MIRLSNAQVRDLVKLLDRAEQIARQHAAEQAYRRDACRAVRERILTDYHDRQHVNALDIAQAVTEAGGSLILKLEAAESAA